MLFPCRRTSSALAMSMSRHESVATPAAVPDASCARNPRRERMPSGPVRTWAMLLIMLRRLLFPGRGPSELPEDKSKDRVLQSNVKQNQGPVQQRVQEKDERPCQANERHQ